jgi:membrane-associated PAP2 superfamily phosphatase
MCGVQYSGLDNWLAQNIYQANLGWGLRDHWLVESVIHSGGRYLVFAIVSSMLIAVVLSYLPRFKHNKYLPLSRYLALSTALAILAVAVFKQASNLPCPWDMSMFGGNRADIKIHQVFSTELANGHCFPSGHASGGYAFFSFYLPRLSPALGTSQRYLINGSSYCLHQA